MYSVLTIFLLRKNMWSRSYTDSYEPKLNSYNIYVPSTKFNQILSAVSKVKCYDWGVQTIRAKTAYYRPKILQESNSDTLVL
jgi:hypothetical protein